MGIKGGIWIWGIQLKKPRNAAKTKQKNARTKDRCGISLEEGGGREVL
jgi:hypothetical protein